MKPRESTLNADELRGIIDYDPETGIMRWRIAVAQCTKVGGIAGSKNAQGYWWVVIHKKHYYAHRLAWLYMTGEWPPSPIDHQDVDKLNNKWKNLRLASHSTNGTNRKLFPTSTTGLKGASWHKCLKKYSATISKNRKIHHLGYFATAEEAHAAYVEASDKYHGQFARAA